MSYQASTIIIAQCTPKGSGSIALIRLSGENVFLLVTKMSQLSSGKTMNNVLSHSINYGSVLNEKKQIIDDVLFLAMRAPKTFTGEDTIEITCHNNQLIIQDIIETAIFYGAQLANKGEFTKRSVLNKKIDILQAEAINELLIASTQEHVKAALAQLQGTLSSYIQNIEEQLYSILSYAQVSFEFIEEENISFVSTIKTIIDEVQEKISWITRYYGQQARIKDGFRVALIGSVNAGKSSLFNALLKKERALVSAIPGTTRDSIENSLINEGITITLVDTAGIRRTDDSIEICGIQRSYDEAKKADIILLIRNTSEIINTEESKIYLDLYETYKDKIIIVHTKSDLQCIMSPFFNDILPVTVANTDNHSIKNLEEIIFQKCRSLLESGNSPFLVSERQFNLILSMIPLIESIKSHLDEPVSYELIAADAANALEIISEISGKTISEIAMNNIFNNFCVGK